jgi:hypothetical protein
MVYGRIYGLYDPISLELRYIGQTKRTLNQRLAAHLRQSNLQRGHRCANWIRSLGQSPEIRELGFASTKAELDRIEMQLISEAWANGAHLTNHTEGGGGTSGFTHTVEARNKMSQARRGVPKSLETRARLSEACRNNPLRVEACQRLGLALAGKSKSAEHRQKLSQALKGKTGKTCSPETRERMSKAAKRREALKREAHAHG